MANLADGVRHAVQGEEASSASAGGGAGEEGAPLDVLSKAASVPDRGGFTRAGRALQKHGSRQDSAFPRTRGTPEKSTGRARTL